VSGGAGGAGRGSGRGGDPGGRSRRGAGGASGRAERDDTVRDARRARATDRDETVYERRRRKQAARRAQQERRAYDPTPPTDEDWTLSEEDDPAVRRISAPTPVGSSLEAIVRRRGWGERLRGAAAWRQWDAIVGPELAQRCEPVRLAGGTLLVRAESQVWATQLKYLLPQLRRNAVRELGDTAVRDIRIVVGPLQGPGGADDDPLPGG
jgi:predicted nucleic acid-binding Zn ribbon protein